MCGSALVAIGAAQAVMGFYLASVLPWSLAAALFLTRQRAVELEFRERSLFLPESGESFDYRSLQGVRFKSMTRRNPVYLLFETRAVCIPGLNRAEKAELYRFMKDFLLDGGSGDLKSPLRDYRQQQVELFGSEKVFSYRARSVFLPRMEIAPFLGVAIALVTSGLVWTIVAGGSAHNAKEGLIAFACLLFFLVFLMAVFAAAGGLRRKPRGIKHWDKSELVISPLGIALVQGQLQGQMSWSELNHLVFKNRETSGAPWSIMPFPFRYLNLKLSGANILVHDLYDRPLAVIHQVLAGYWRH
ncbi:MAG TPA: hypothetical protein VFE24_15040 [Pirellulales bacterium]|nr:hypothetical protein [Pirellulales bacterium]